MHNGLFNRFDQYMDQMRFTWTILLLQALAPRLVAQEKYLVNCQVYLEDEPTTGVKVLLYDDSRGQNIASNNDGVFSSSLDWGKMYRFHFIKLNYVTKIVEFSTKVPNGIKKESIEPYLLQVRLFKVFDGVDSIFFKNPVAKIRYDVRMGDFDYDTDYSLMVKQRIDEMMRQKGGTKGTGEAGGPKKQVIDGKKATSTLSKSSSVPKGTLKKTATVELLGKTHIATPTFQVLPALKPYYPLGRSVEEYELEKKHITRVVMKYSDKQKVLLKVKHDWGAVYYFVDESPLTTRCVSRAVYERETLLPNGD